MADIKLVRPSAGQTAVIPSAPDARMVLDFSADQVSIERPQGSDSLFFRFDDGAAIELQNFYTQYNKDTFPHLRLTVSSLRVRIFSTPSGQTLPLPPALRLRPLAAADTAILPTRGLKTA